MKDLILRVVLKGLEDVEGVKEDVVRGIEKMGLVADVSEICEVKELKEDVDKVIDLVDYYWGGCIDLEELMESLKVVLPEIKERRMKNESNI